MTDTNLHSGASNSQPTNWLGSGAIVVAMGLAIAAAYWLWTAPPNIDRSVIGTNGLAYYAKNQGLDSSIYKRGPPIAPDIAGLRVIPLYTADTSKSANKDEKDDFSTAIRTIPEHILRRKIDRVPTLLVLPKWRYGAVRLERLHPSLLIDKAGFRVFRPLQLDRQSYEDGSRNVALQVAAGSHMASLLNDSSLPDVSVIAPQTLSEKNLKLHKCKPALISGEKVFLAECQRGANGPRYWILSDPDIINNYGLVRGQNAEFAVSLLKALAGGKPVVFDQTVREPRGRNRDTGDERGRSFSDLSRFFQYPFSLAWLALAMASGFLFWRAWTRFGAAQSGSAENRIAISKRTAIDANIHILRASKSDGPLAAAHIAQRLERLSVDLLGSQRRTDKDAAEQVIALVKRRFPELGNRLAHQHQQLAPGYGIKDTGRIAGLLTQFEKTLQEIRHEFGRSTKPRL